MKVLTHFNVLNELNPLFPGAMKYTLDATYNVVTRESVRKFGDELLGLYKHFGVAEWDDSWDCEDFSILGWAVAKIKHHRSGDSQKISVKRHLQARLAEGVAVGVMCYHIDGDPQRGHAIMLFRTEDGWEGWEPQRQVFLTLSQLEKLSAWLILL